MSGMDGTKVRAQLRRLALLTLGLVPAVLIFLCASLWLHSSIPTWLYWKAGLIFLTALEVIYWLTVVLTFLCVLVTGVLVFRRGRRGLAPGGVPRIPLLCINGFQSFRGGIGHCGLAAPIASTDRASGRWPARGDISHAILRPRRRSGGHRASHHIPGNQGRRRDQYRRHG